MDCSGSPVRTHVVLLQVQFALQNKYSTTCMQKQQFMSPFAPENLVSRDGFGSPVPRRPDLHTQAGSGAYLLTYYGIPPDFRGGAHLFI